ncbi:hypothetical protein [Streptomyces sp. NPDC047315]|uniref:hypothetical protein n=1 Tax=Streptomyces sp. NPDC047315 TaxID=3155142 RepID=UPI0033ECEEBE
MSDLISNSGVRINRAPYVHVDSGTVRDTTMSYRALGMLTYLLDQSEDWQVKSEQLTKGEGREGRQAIRKTLHELARRGYYRLERRRFLDNHYAMGTAISVVRVEQWARDYVTFGEKLDVPVVEQEDGSFLVQYPDGSLGSDGFAADTRDRRPEDDEPETGTEDDEPETGAEDDEPAAPTPKTAPAKRQPRSVKKPPAAKAPKAKTEAAQQKAAEDALLDVDAERVAEWWWAEAKARFGPYVGSTRGYVAMRTQVRSALKKGYTKNDCGRALIHAAKHWPSAQQWQEALGVVTNRIQPRQAHGRTPYNNTSTWGDQDTPPPGATAAPPPVDDDFDDATFGVIERP